MSAIQPKATSCPGLPSLDLVRRTCELRVAAHAEDGLPSPGLQGQLIRPLVALAGSTEDPDDRLWDAALAVQYAHEASLLHDDVIDGAVRRRGAPTVVAARGVAAALVEGDHLLTAAYRLAAATASLPFAALFARAVERTVAGEKRQAAFRGRVLTADEYRAVIEGKSGELLGAAFAAGPLLRGEPHALRWYEVGRAVGVCYQLVDDLLDYCPGVDTGKAAFGDFRQRIWTWPLAYLPRLDWELAPERVLEQLASTRGGEAPLAAALQQLRAVIDDTAAAVRELVPQDVIITSLLCEWLNRAERAVDAALVAAPTANGATPVTPVSHSLPSALPRLPAERELAAFFAANSRSFSFAARLFPAAERARVADVYAFCRVTDDLADGGELPPSERSARLDAWLELCRRSHSGEPTGLPVLDRLLRDAAGARVPFRYVEDLVAGMRMDLAPRRYESLADLRVYTHRVASVVGLWLTRLWGVHDERVLQGAASLGHAMQLTNILRDVGEDLARGRVYLPADLLARYHVDDALLGRMAATGRIPARWRGLTGELMAVADAHYERAFAAIPALPRPVRAPVAVAAGVYRGIHDEIRRNGYDNLTRRARTSLPRKVWLACGALWRLSRSSARAPLPRRRALARAFGTVAAVLLALAFAAGLQAQRTRPAAALTGGEARPVVLSSDSLLALERVHWLYRTGVEREAAVAEAEAALAALRTSYPGLAAGRAALLDGYAGALRLLRAKHGSWPPSRIGHVRAGLALLDAAVRAAPSDPDVRYLRLLSCYHLPGIFGRGDTVREDFAALATLLSGAGAGSPALRTEMLEFVLAHGNLDAAARARLEARRGSHG